MGERVELPDGWRQSAFTRREARATGIGDGRLRGEDLEAPFHGVRAVAGSCEDLEPRCRAYFARPRGGQALAGATALRILGFPAPRRFERETDLEIAVPHSRARPKARGVVPVRVRDELWRTATVRGLPVLEPVACWLHLARRLRLHEAVVIADSLVTANRNYPGLPRPLPTASVDDLALGVEAYGRAPGAVLLRAALEKVRLGSASPMETLTRCLLASRGLPEPSVNEAVVDEAGRFLGEGDLVYRDARVVVEYQGDQHRVDAAQFRGDIERRRRFVAAGWLVIEASAADVRDSGRRLAAEVRRALDLRAREAGDETVGPKSLFGPGRKSNLGPTV